MSDTYEEQTRALPQDTQAERSVLGAMLLSTGARNEVVDLLVPGDFYAPANEHIFTAILELHRSGQPCDAVSLIPELIRRETLTKVGGAPYVHTLIETVPTTANAAYYAEIVRDRAMLREVIKAGTQVVQRGYNPGMDSGYAVAEWAASHVGAVRDIGLYEDAATPTLQDLLAEDVAYDWLIPGLLERGDRLVITGGEGMGKSTLIRQLAICAAAGLHPFTHEPVEPMCVLVVDLENGRHMSQRRYRPIAEAARFAGAPVNPQRFFIEIKPSGLDVTRPADARWLLKRVETIRPDLLVIGPAYRMAGGDPNDERTAREVTQVLDRAREAAGCTLIAETHSPHAGGGMLKRPIRPVGSSLWMRWPEFGYGIRLAEEPSAEIRRLMDFVPWRGPRDERQWPHQIEAAHPWPWREA